MKITKKIEQFYHEEDRRGVIVVALVTLIFVIVMVGLLILAIGKGSDGVTAFVVAVFIAFIFTVAVLKH